MSLFENKHLMINVVIINGLLVTVVATAEQSFIEAFYELRTMTDPLLVGLFNSQEEPIEHP